MLGRGYPKEMIEWTGWNLRDEGRLLPTTDVCHSFVQSIMMNIIIWNCRGALKPSFQSNVCDLVSIHDLAILIVMETRLGKDKTKEITDRLPFQGANGTITSSQSYGLYGTIVTGWYLRICLLVKLYTEILFIGQWSMLLLLRIP